MTVKQRLVEYLKYKGIGQNKFERLAGISNGYISNLKAAPGAVHLTKILNAADDLNKDWLLTGDGQMLVEAEESGQIVPVPPSEGRPYYNVDFKLGYDIMFNDQTTIPHCFVSFPPNNVDCWCNAYGNSMAPTISSGDIVGLKLIEDPSTLINGEIYAIVTSNGLRTIKRIHDNGTTFTLTADNHDVPSQTIPKSVITTVFQVLAVHRIF